VVDLPDLRGDHDARQHGHQVRHTAAGIGLLALLVFGVLAALPPVIGDYSPTSLATPALALMLGHDPGSIAGALLFKHRPGAGVVRRHLAGVPAAGAVETRPERLRGVALSFVAARP